MNLPSPKVSVICTCYNHEQYVTESLQSVMDQSYSNYELIVVDDGSGDNSVQVIDNFLVEHPEVKFIRHKENQGLCKAFNTAFEFCTGDYIIDLAADDVLLPERLSNGVNAFAQLDERWGVIFSDAEWVDQHGRHLYFHSQKFPHHTIPQGDIYKDLIERYFICSPTMMFRRSVLKALDGYDETLTYEDFDFWIRSSRIFFYHYDAQVLVKKRKLKHSLSHRQTTILNKHNDTTYRVCEKILDLNKSREEQKALAKRIEYEIRQCIRTFDVRLVYQYFKLWLKNRSLRYATSSSDKR